MKARRIVLFAGLTVLLGFANVTLANTYTWTNSTSAFNEGSGTWNTSSANWWNGSNNIWNNANADTAQFGSGSGAANAYSVTLSGSTSAGGVIFQNQAYTITGQTLNLAGSAPTVAVNAANGTISSIITGTGGLTKTGTGTLTIGTAQTTFTGPLYILNGKLIASSAGNGQTTLPAGSTVYLGDTSGANNATLQIANGYKTLFNGKVVVQSGNTGTSLITFNSYPDAGPEMLGTITLGTANQAGHNLTISNGNGFGLPIGATIQDASGALSSGTVTINTAGYGPIYFYGNNTYSGGTIISANSSLYIGNSYAYQTDTAHGSLGTGPVANSGTLTFSRTDSYGGPVANAISGSGKLTLSTGTLTLTGSNTYSGVTTISAGVLQIGNGGTIGTLGTGAVSDSGTLAFNRTDNYGGPVGSAISGTGKLTLNAGTLTLSGSNGYSGVTTINNGTLQFANEKSLYGGTTSSWTAANLVVNNGATAAFNVGGANQFTTGDIATLVALGTSTGGFTSGSAIGLDTTGGNFSYGAIANPNGGGNTLGLTKLGDLTLTLSGVNTYTGPTTVSAGTLAIGSAGQLNSGNYGAAVSIASGAAFSYNSSAPQTLSGAISGSGALNQAGPGGLTLSGSNNFSGGTTLGNNSALVLGNSAALGTGALTISGGSLDSSVANLVNANNNPQNWNANFTFVGTNNLNLGNGDVTLGASPQVTVAGGTLTAGGNVSGSSFGVTKAGTGMLSLSGVNTYGGGTTLAAGILQANGPQALSNTGNIAFAGGSLQYTAASAGGTDYSGRIKASGSAVTIDTGGQMVNFAGVIDSFEHGRAREDGRGDADALRHEYL